MDASEYQPGARRLTPAERARELKWLQDQAAREAQRERERQAIEERARQAAAAARAARPPGERLLEARCGPCHGPDQLRARRYGRLGWWAVLARMQWLNGARFDSGERRAIVAYLVATQRAGWKREALEWAIAAAIPTLSLAALGWYRLRRAGRCSLATRRVN